MVSVKHFLDTIEPEDGQRIWVEPIGLTHELKDWCQVSSILSHLGPPRAIWDWFSEHPDGYDFSRIRYHALGTDLTGSRFSSLPATPSGRTTRCSTRAMIPSTRPRSAAIEFLAELEAYCPHDQD